MFISFSALTLQSRHRDGFARSLRFHIDYCRVMHEQDINNCSPWSLMVSNGADANFEISTSITIFTILGVPFNYSVVDIYKDQPTLILFVFEIFVIYKARLFTLSWGFYYRAYFTELISMKIFYLIILIINYFHNVKKNTAIIEAQL